MEFLLRFVMLLVTCVAVIRGEPTAHRCMPGTESFVCLLPFFDYNPDESIPLFHLPKDVKTIRFIHPFYNLNDRSPCLERYDELLHRQLSFPLAVELKRSCTHTIEMPPTLVYGDFSESSIATISAPSNQTYALRYLNLNYNFRLTGSQMGNISKFVNLETLYLSNNDMTVVPKDLFANMKRLAYLSLSHTQLRHFDLTILAPSLTMLSLDTNDVTSLNFAKAHFPLLVDLNIEYNELRDVDVDELLKMAPKLQLVALGHNPIKRENVVSILNALDARNVAYYNVELPGDKCQYGEERFRGACLPTGSIPGEMFSLLETILWVFLAVGALFGLMFGGVKLWKTYHPS